MTEHAFATLWPTTPFAAKAGHPPSATLRAAELEEGGRDEEPFGGSANAALHAQADVETAMRLVRGPLLGRGGMGEVFAANQEALGREVAVKVATQSRGAHKNERRLLQEAWAMGALEHPNVVPVHHLGLDAEGVPQIVMKKIAGESLSSRIGRRMPASDAEGLASDLEVLMEVARAVAFAHSRGIVHRDIKPDNIMVGEYGEVYLLDWGIAVATRDEHKPRLRMADDITQSEGTPHYMAPEMVHRPLGAIGERTDVYLLGGTLHHLLTGSPPHTGATLFQIISSIVVDDRSRSYPEDVPPELRAIAERAMAFAPEERFASAEAFRAALAEALRHTASRSLARQSASRLARLIALTDARLSASEHTIQDANQLFTEGMFGCEQALQTWPDNPLALATRRDLVKAMGQFELDGGRIDSAQGVLARLEAPPADLVERLQLLLADRAEEQNELASRRQNADLRIAASTRVRVAWLMAFGTSAYALLVAALGISYPVVRSGPVAIAGTALILVGAAVLTWLSRRGTNAILRNQVNRQILTVTALMLVSVTLMRVHGTLAGETYAVLSTRTMFFWALTASILGATIDGRLAASALPALVGWVGASVWPELALWITPPAYFVSCAILALIWGRDASRERAEADDA